MPFKAKLIKKAGTKAVNASVPAVRYALVWERESPYSLSDTACVLRWISYFSIFR